MNRSSSIANIPSVDPGDVEAPNEQRRIVAFLSAPATYGLPDGAAIERIDTHISIVWLAAARADKLKRAVRFDYVDFSTPELRHAACDAESRLNRRTAPSLYLGVRAVTREADGMLALDGPGTPLDWLVEMVRFDQDALFDRRTDRVRVAADCDWQPLPGAPRCDRRLRVADVRSAALSCARLAWG